MTQHLFNSDAPATGSDKGVLDAMFTEIYGKTALLSPGTNSLGLGATPNAWGGGLTALEGGGGAIAFSASTGAYFSGNLSFNGSNWIYKNAGYGSLFLVSGGGYQIFSAAPSTAGATATLVNILTGDSLGNVMVGTATNSVGSGGVVIQPTGTSANAANINIGHPTGAATGAVYAQFVYNGTVIGSITQNGTTGVAYNTSSDYRLKNAVAPIAGSGAFIDALKPCTWTWISDGTTGAGFIAHELQAVSPGSVTGAKDAVDAAGKPIYQAVEYGSAEVIAMMVSELKALRARVATLEAH